MPRCVATIQYRWRATELASNLPIAARHIYQRKPCPHIPSTIGAGATGARDFVDQGPYVLRRRSCSSESTNCRVEFTNRQIKVHRRHSSIAHCPPLIRDAGALVMLHLLRPSKRDRGSAPQASCKYRREIVRHAISCRRVSGQSSARSLAQLGPSRSGVESAGALCYFSAAS